MKNREVKNTCNGFISRLDTAEERIHEQEKSIEVTQTENRETKISGVWGGTGHPKPVGQY